MTFAHLHAYTHYSFLDALARPSDYVEMCKKYGMTACAITDHGGMYGVIEFYKAMKAQDVKPIIGMDAYIASQGLADKTPENKRYRLVLLAKNNVGYQNLMKLTSISHLEGFYYKPRIDDELLTKHSSGLIALSHDMWGEVATKILSHDYDGARKTVEKYQDIFGKDSFFLELQYRPEISNYAYLREKLIQLSHDTGSPLVATNSCRYKTLDDKIAHDAFVCIGTQKFVTDEDRIRYEGDYSIASPDDMISRFGDVPEAVSNTMQIVDMCDVNIEFGTSHLPQFPTISGLAPDVELRNLCEAGLVRRYAADVLDKANERLQYELSVIEKMGYATYFLIVNDFITEARRRGISVGPGRGSAAGAIISYTLGITNIEPLSNNLLFERFLNPQRAAMPDIDIDFADDRRDEILEYVTSKYGENRVAQIITFGTLAPKAAVRDAGRVLGFGYAEVDRLAKLIPEPVLGKHKPLKESIDNDPQLHDEYKNNANSKQILDIALKFENAVRHMSTHACAVVISDQPITNYAPLQRATGDRDGVITQYEMNAIADIGLLKMDFLGLRNLTILKTTVEIIKRTKNKDIDLEALPHNDKKTFKLVAEGKTTGIFQFESSGMKRYLKELKPTEFEDLVAMNSLYRPGPMEFIPQYIKGKHNPKSIHYIHDSLRPVLERTYGVAVYQEQIMELAQIFTGMALGEAYVLLKGIAKKKPEIVMKMRAQFVDGAITKGHSKEFALEVFEKVIEPFAGYGFNKSHAACYSWIAYQTAYLKAHFPAEFMAALLSSDPDNTEKVVIAINECEAMGIHVLPPQINTSLAHFTVLDDKTVGFGLTAIKGLGENTARAIIAARGDKQFKDIEDFAARVPFKILNKKTIEALALSGALDAFGERFAIAQSFDEISRFARTVQTKSDEGQTDIFGLMSSEDGFKPAFHFVKCEPASLFEKLQLEKKYLGLYVTRHPLDGLRKYLSKKITLAEKFSVKLCGQQFKVGGLVTEVKKIMTKAGKFMMYVKMEDPSGRYEVVVFPNAFSALGSVIKEDAIVVLTGRLEMRGKFQFLAESGQEVQLEKLIEHAKKEGFYVEDDRVKFEVPDEIVSDSEFSTEEVAANVVLPPYLIEIPKGTSLDVLEALKKMLKEHKGDMQVEIKLPVNKSEKIVDTVRVPFTVHVDEELKQKISSLLNSK